MNKPNFSTVTYAELQQLVDLSEVDLSEEVDDSRLADWLCEDHILDSADAEFVLMERLNQDTSTMSHKVTTVFGNTTHPEFIRHCRSSAKNYSNTKTAHSQQGSS